MKRVKTSVNLDPEVIEFGKKYAKKSKRTFSLLLEIALIEYVNNHPVRELPAENEGNEFDEKK